VSPSATCASGMCGGCGGLSKVCCVSVATNICTAPNTYCSTQLTQGTCLACGGMGQACCGPQSAFDRSGTSCDVGLTCRPGGTQESTCQP
jgi:hypothetical protein